MIQPTRLVAFRSFSPASSRSPHRASAGHRTPRRKPPIRLRCPRPTTGCREQDRSAATTGSSSCGASGGPRGRRNARAGPGRGGVPGRLDHAALGRRAAGGVPRREDREPRHQRRHDARRVDPAAGRRAGAEAEGRGAAHRHQRPRRARHARDHRRQREADSRGDEGVTTRRCRSSCARSFPALRR